jgi:plastocyanin
MARFQRLLAPIVCAALAACSARARDRADTSGPRVIVVRLVTDDRGNYFDPAQISAHRGDTLRFTLARGSGVHNVDFTSDGNRPAGFPGASALLQEPGQSLDVPVTFAPGQYHFQCDPHAALGMVGTLRVE